MALKENIRVENKLNIQTKVMTTLFTLFAEVGRDLYLRAHPRGLARARASGRKLEGLLLEGARIRAELGADPVRGADGFSPCALAGSAEPPPVRRLSPRRRS